MRRTGTPRGERRQLLLRAVVVGVIREQHVGARGRRNLAEPRGRIGVRAEARGIGPEVE